MIYKLKYTDKAEAIQHLKDLNVIDENEEYTDITHAVVYIGLIVDEPAQFDKDWNELTPATYLDGYHVDVMTKEIVNFGDKEVFTENPRHQFSK